MDSAVEVGTAVFPEGELALADSSQNENANWENASGGCKRQGALLGQVSAAEEDVSLQCGLHAYRFSLRDFDIGGYLGDGAQGSVFVARERRSGFVCVLKCITKAHLIRGGNEALLKKEVELQAHLKHPHICCMYTWFQTASTIFLVMEYCHRGDLFALLDETENGFEEPQVAKMIFQIAWAIRTCHDKRIAHLDIKPENVLVNERGDLKLADFGLSAHIGGAHRKKGVSIHRGTCDYFSPEQCLARMKAGVADRQKRLAQQKQLLQQMRQRGDTPTPEQLKQVQALEQKLEQLQRTLAQAVNGVGGQFDEKSDIWMIGVLAFELYFKAPPFGSQCLICEEELMRNVTTSDWTEKVTEEAKRNPVVRQKLQSMSPEFKEFLCACLHRVSARRPTAERLLNFPFLEKHNRQTKASLVFLEQPRHNKGHRGFNQPGIPWQTPRHAPV